MGISFVFCFQCVFFIGFCVVGCYSLMAFSGFLLVIFFILLFFIRITTRVLTFGCCLSRCSPSVCFRGVRLPARFVCLYHRVYHIQSRTIEPNQPSQFSCYQCHPLAVVGHCTGHLHVETRFRVSLLTFRGVVKVSHCAATHSNGTGEVCSLLERQEKFRRASLESLSKTVALYRQVQKKTKIHSVLLLSRVLLSEVCVGQFFEKVYPSAFKTSPEVTNRLRSSNRTRFMAHVFSK